MIWTRLTAREEADRRIAEWDEKEPKQWSVPGAPGEVGIVVRAHPAGDTPDGEQAIRWVKVGPATDSCHQFRLKRL